MPSADGEDDEATAVVEAAPRSQALWQAPAARGREESLGLTRAAENFELTSVAKMEIVRASVLHFAEVLNVKLRGLLALAQQPPVQSSRTWMPNKQQVAALAAALVLSQFSQFKRLARRVLAAVVAYGAGDRAWKEAVLAHRRWRANNVASAFVIGPAAAPEDRQIQIDRSIRLIVEAIVRRHAAQIIPLTKPSQTLLAQAMASRIVQHFKRHPMGLEFEPRKPLDAAWLHVSIALEQQWHALFSPPDKIPVVKSISLVDRCMRALTAETRPGDETVLEFEPYLSSVNRAFASQPWTVGGVLNKPGLRVADALFVHEFSDPENYGWCQGTVNEALERGMRAESKL